MPNAGTFGKHLEQIKEPLRIPDFHAYAEAEGLPEFAPPFPISSVSPLLVVPVRHQGLRFGTICLLEKQHQASDADDALGVEQPAGTGAETAQVEGIGVSEFSVEDEETLVMFAAQAALVIRNARTHRDEQRARARSETLLNTAPVGVLVFDAGSGELESANREAHRIAGELESPGASVQDLLAAAVYRDVDGGDIAPDALPIARALSSGESVAAEEIIIEASSGRCVAAIVNATPVRNDDGVVESVIATVQDITALRELERLRVEFLGMVGHELRMPLTSIKGSAAALLAERSSLSSAEGGEYLRIIDEQADHMQGLIADLIDVVRIETGTLSVVPGPVEVAVMVDEARNRFLAAGGRDRVRISLAPDLPQVMAERRRVVQVLANLLSNAERNSHDDSSMRVAAESDGVHVVISVADDGRGLAADRIPDLFAKFSRSRPAGRGPDLGLGLAICKGIVEAHGGRIRAHSDGPGLGSRFEFTIPAVGPADSGAANPDGAPGRAGEGRTRVLMLDDDPRTLRLVRDTLEDADHEVTVTGDPQQLGALIDETDPHVLVMDMMLPGTDGIELMNSVVAGCDAPVIFLSAYDRSELIADAFAAGAVDYIIKPFAPTELIARVNAALRKGPERSTTFTLGDLTVNYAHRSVTVAGRQVELAPLEYRLLSELASNPGAVLGHRQLVQALWGHDDHRDTGHLRTVVKDLRHKLGDRAKNPRYIVTVPRVGYRMPRPHTA